jgi:mono/diheme cytochrome c family protein/cytochrome c2
MKKVFRYLLLFILVVAVLASAFVAYVSIKGVPSYTAEKIQMNVNATPEHIAKGQKLASMLCKSCHLNEGTGKFTGRKMEEVPQFGEIYSKNITNDPDHGIGKWTDGELAVLLRTGVKPDGRYLPPYMPKLVHLSDVDLQSVIAFLRSDHAWVKADNTRQPDTKPSFLTKFLTTIGAMEPFPYPKQSIPEPDTTNKTKWGEYIAIGQLECFSCHSKDFAKNDYYHPEKSEGFFGGGNELIGMEGKKLKSRNITLDETGIGGWSEEEFVRAVKSGIVPGNQPALRPPMQPYAELSDSEVKAIYAYLKTVPKLKNKVDRNL